MFRISIWTIIMEIQYSDKFEYNYKKFGRACPIRKIVENLNELGQLGWELIEITKDEYEQPTYIFKRKIMSKKIENEFA